MAGTAAGAAKARAKLEAKRTESAPKRYIVAGKPLKDGKRVYQVGEIYPKAHLLLRLDGWLRTGRLIEA